MLLTCLTRAAVGADRAVFVGDTSVDRDAALAANVSYVGVGPHSGAEWTIDDLRELPELLEIPR
jgi:phosphoglycolate phosphatase-like HAD superfamily hydrolase